VLYSSSVSSGPMVSVDYVYTYAYIYVVHCIRLQYPHGLLFQLAKYIHIYVYIYYTQCVISVFNILRAYYFSTLYTYICVYIYKSSVSHSCSISSGPIIPVHVTHLHWNECKSSIWNGNISSISSWPIVSVHACYIRNTTV